MKRLLVFLLAFVLTAQVRIPGPGAKVGGAPPMSSPFITGQVLGTLRNDFGGSVGFHILVGAAPLTVTDIGRWVVAGNSQTHALKICTASCATTVATVTVDTSGAMAGQYLYGSITPVTLSAATDYYVMSAEASGQDQWYDADTTVMGTADGSVMGTTINGGNNGSMNTSYVPVNFKYHL